MPSVPLRSPRAIVLACLLLVVAPLFAASSAPTDEEFRVASDLLRMVNAERIKRGLPAVRSNDNLAQAARDHCTAMADAKKLAHTVSGELELGPRVTQTGLRFDSLGENVSRSSEGGDPADNAHQTLMASPRHRDNILDTRYNAVGIGVVRRGSYVYVTQDFAHMYDDMTPQQAEQAVLRTFQRARASAKLGATRVVRLDRLDSMACDPDIKPDLLITRFTSSQAAVVFTIWNTDDLPEPMLTDARRRDLNAVALRACSLEPTPGGNGGFRVVAVFF
jgi:hypothetical protein